MTLNKFLDLFSSPITIHVHPELFRFSIGNDNLQLETYLNLHMVDGKYKVHSAGGDASNIADTVRIDLFQNSELPDGVNRMEALESYLRYAIQKLCRKSRLIRPVITVKNVQSLDDILMGYQHYLMRPVLLGAGAREVRFE